MENINNKIPKYSNLKISLPLFVIAFLIGYMVHGGTFEKGHLFERLVFSFFCGGLFYGMGMLLWWWIKNHVKSGIISILLGIIVGSIVGFIPFNVLARLYFSSAEDLGFAFLYSLIFGAPLGGIIGGIYGIIVYKHFKKIPSQKYLSSLNKTPQHWGKLILVSSITFTLFVIIYLIIASIAIHYPHFEFPDFVQYLLFFGIPFISGLFLGRFFGLGAKWKLLGIFTIYFSILFIIYFSFSEIEVEELAISPILVLIFFFGALIGGSLHSLKIKKQLNISPPHKVSKNWWLKSLISLCCFVLWQIIFQFVFKSYYLFFGGFFVISILIGKFFGKDSIWKLITPYIICSIMLVIFGVYLEVTPLTTPRPFMTGNMLTGIYIRIIMVVPLIFILSLLGITIGKKWYNWHNKNNQNEINQCQK